MTMYAVLKAGTDLKRHGRLRKRYLVRLARARR